MARRNAVARLRSQRPAPGDSHHGGRVPPGDERRHRAVQRRPRQRGRGRRVGSAVRAALRARGGELHAEGRPVSPLGPPRGEKLGAARFQQGAHSLVRRGDSRQVERDADRPATFDGRSAAGRAGARAGRNVPGGAARLYGDGELRRRVHVAAVLQPLRLHAHLRAGVGAARARRGGGGAAAARDGELHGGEPREGPRPR